MTVSVITSSIGRPELRQCVESVRSQSYAGGTIRHYVYANGQRHHAKTREVLADFPEVQAIYLPEETGDYGAGPSMADVFAAAPFLTRADWIFFLDDDNFFDPNHVESVMTLARENDLAWAYSLRRFVAQEGSPICDDDWCSLGHLSLPSALPHLVDNSCYAVSRPLATRLALAWTAQPIVADRCFFMALKESGARSGCTGLSSVNYRVGTGTAPADPAAYLRSAEQIRREIPDGFPWRKPAIFA